ncbi:MAG: hypothetical protein EPO39_10290 [Candidatus Manganitrophaceae bacterium]|nr:MAG: hypothetical protein EPO39_10290 [Candidatus Manganitrophaceae bacterium]
MECLLIIGLMEKPWNTANYLVTAASNLGFRVVSFDPLSEGASLDALERQIKAHRPTYALIQRGHGFSVEWNEALKRQGLFTLLWYPDPDVPDWLVPLAKSVDFFFTMAEGNIPKWKEAGIKQIAWLSQGFEPSSFKIDSISEEDRRFYGSEVAFVGNIDSTNHYLSRRYKLKRVLREGFDLKWWGPRLGRKPVNLPIFFSALGRAYGGKFVYGPEYAKVVQSSKILLALDRHTHIRLSMSARMYTAVGCGAFYMCEAMEGLETMLVPDKEIVTFKGDDEMIDKIRYYLPRESERSAIARAGQERVLREHTYQKRLERMFQIVQNRSSVA